MKLQQGQAQQPASNNRKASTLTHLVGIADSLDISISTRAQNLYQSILVCTGTL